VFFKLDCRTSAIEYCYEKTTPYLKTGDDAAGALGLLETAAEFGAGTDAVTDGLEVLVHFFMVLVALAATDTVADGLFHVGFAADAQGGVGARMTVRNDDTQEEAERGEKTAASEKARC